VVSRRAANVSDSERLYDGTRDLLNRLADRLPPADLETFRSFHDVGEPLLLLDQLCAGLVKWQTPITRDERDALASILADLPIPEGGYRFLENQTEVLAGLNVVE
jgi:hypothetical protein